MKIATRIIVTLLLTMTLAGCSASEALVYEDENLSAVVALTEASDETTNEAINDAADNNVTGEIPETGAVSAVSYNLKINPEFEIKADENLIVTEVIAKNTDAENVLAAVNAVGLTVSDAFALLTEEAKSQGYMTEEKGNTVVITILEKDDELLPTCPVCDGCGTVVCKDCHGTGIACRCDRCKGTGAKPSDSNPSPDCWLCHGTGVCPECGGTGQVVVTNGEDGGVVYVAPGVPEMGVCSTCWGTGGCDNCHGASVSNGESTAEDDGLCEGCHGAGYLYCHDDLNGYSWCPCCWGSGIEGTGDPDYLSYYTPAEKYETEEWLAILNNGT